MTIAQAFGEGMRRLNRAPRVWWIWYAATTAPALFGAAIVLSLANASLDSSAWTSALGRNLDLSWISELVAEYGGVLLAPFPALIAGVLAIFAVVYVLLLGGALETLCGGGSFFAGCGAHFWRLVRLAIFTAICAIPVLILNTLLNRLGQKVWGEGSAATPLVYWGWFRVAVLLFLLGIVNLAFEYAATRLVVEDSRKAWRALMAAFRLIARHPFRTMGLYLLLGLVLLLVVAIGFGVSRAAAQTTPAAVVLLFLFRQVVVLAKIWAWLLFFPAQAAMWESISGTRLPARAVVATAESVPIAAAEAAPEDPHVS